MTETSSPLLEASKVKGGDQQRAHINNRVSALVALFRFEVKNNVDDGN